MALVLLVGFGLRVGAALVVERYVGRLVPPRHDVFPDTEIYWRLAQAIRAGEPYQVSLWNVPHRALRTPGYPLFLAACQAVFGDRTLPVRLVQAALGAGCAWLVARLLRRVAPDSAPVTPVVAAALVAVEPYGVAMSVLVLSEAIFVPLMLLTLWGLATLWPAARDEGGVRRSPWLAIVTGAAAGAAILARPSWALFVPAMLLAWVAASPKGGRVAAMRGAVLVGLGVVVVMAPWWVRNAQVFGRFVPTALWVGPSLYDGLSPTATGASDMAFLNEPEIRKLDEWTMDASLRARGWAFAREHPGRALELAAIKSARFWSPWPNADVLRRPEVALASAVVTLPLYALMLLGTWGRLARGDVRGLVLLAGPILYFWALHAVFVGSVRYRVPGAVPALGLAALGVERLFRRARGMRPAGS